jgi:hypothetical protein
VVRREARRRWLLVLGGVASLCALPGIVAAFPLPQPSVSAEQLRERILASATVPYQGYAESRGSLGLPDLPGLGDVTALLGGTSRIRVWYASGQRWRVDVIEPTGERDLYRSPGATSIWDYERNMLTEVVGDTPVRLPQATDLLPPDLARLLLRGAASNDAVTAIRARRVAGVAAAGLRLVPADPGTLVGRVDVWAERSTGLPLEVRVTGRAGGGTVLVTRFLDLRREPPDASTITPVRPPSAGFTAVGAGDLAAAMSRFAPYYLPDRLAGRARVPVPDGFRGVAGYGSGLSAFVVLPLPGRLGRRSLNSAREAGATPLAFASGEGMLVQTPVLTALVVRSSVDRRTFLLAGPVTADVLRGAATELLAAPEEPP